MIVRSGRIVLVFLVVLVCSGGPASRADAATLTSFTVTPSTSASDASGAITYAFNLAGTSYTPATPPNPQARCLTVQFDAVSDMSSGALPTGMTGTGWSLTGSAAVYAPDWGTGTLSGNKVTWTYQSSGDSHVYNAGLVVAGITHNPTATGTYYAKLSTFSDNGCSVSIDVGRAAFTLQSAVAVSAQVVPWLSFGVGPHSGACNGGSLSGSASGNAVSLGVVSVAANAVAAQDLSVTANAGNGYSAYVRQTTDLSSQNGHIITPLAGATNTSPVPFSAPGTESWGYTTDHLLSGTGAQTTRFRTNKWAAMSSTDAEVAYGSGVTSSADVACVAHQMGISSTTPAGFYASTIVYTVVPSF